MVSLKGRFPLLLTALAVVLAGCANKGDDADNGGSPGGDVTPPPATSPEQARDLLGQATTGLPDKVATRATVVKGSQTLLSLNGTFDNATGTSYIEVRGDPEALGGLAGQGGQGAGALASSLRDGLSLYAGPEGSLYLVNGTAVAFPPGNASGRGGLGIPPPGESPFGQMLDPQVVLSALHASNVTVQSVNGTVYRGKPALEVALTRPAGEGEPVELLVILFTQPARVAHVEGTAPRDADGPADPFAGARFAADFYYDGEVVLEVPEAARRAVGLAYVNDQPAIGGDPRVPMTWTFQSSAGVPLDEVEAQVKARPSDPTDVQLLSSAPVRWSMKLSEGAKTQDGLTVTFTDADGDGEVSKGDTLRFEGDRRDVILLLQDTKTGTLVVPAPSLLLGLAGLGALALLLRRRG